MNSRRNLLATLGVVALAGCTTESTEPEPESEPESNPEPDRELSVPFGGLGAYEEALNGAEGLDDADGVTSGHIKNILEGSDTVQEEAEALAEITYINDAHSVLQEYHLQKNEGDDMVVGNINWSFTSDSEPILELHTVQNGELQGNPIISDTSQGSITTHKPGQQEPQYLKGIRNDENWASRTPQDYDAEEGLRNDFEEWSEEEKRSRRETTQRHFSAGIFGVDSEDNIINYDAESANVLFDALYNGENTEAAVELSNQYAESGYADSDVVVSAEYTGEGWTFREHPEMEIGDSLPGEDDFFKLTDNYN